MFIITLHHTGKMSLVSAFNFSCFKNKQKSVCSDFIDECDSAAKRE